MNAVRLHCANKVTESPFIRSVKKNATQNLK